MLTVSCHMSTTSTRTIFLNVCFIDVIQGWIASASSCAEDDGRWSGDI